MRKSRQRSTDYGTGSYKSSPIHSSPKVDRPVFIDLCSCCKSSDVKICNSVSKTLPLTDLLSEKKVNSFFTSWIPGFCLQKFLKSNIEELLVHPGQMEVLEKVTQRDKKVVIVMDNNDKNHLDVFSVLMCLERCKSKPSTISEELFHNLKPNNPSNMLVINGVKIKLLSARSEEIALPHNWGNLSILTKEVFFEAVQNLSIADNQELDENITLVQAAVEQKNNKHFVSFSPPVNLKDFCLSSQNIYTEESCVRIIQHVKYMRQRLMKGSLEECVQFIHHNKSLFPDMNLYQALHQLRSVIWEAGGDLGFSLEQYEQQLQQNIEAQHVNIMDQHVESNCNYLNIYYHVESVLAVAIISLIKAPLRLLRSKKGFTVKRADILRNAETLAALLGSGAEMQYPCESVSSTLYNGLSKLDCRAILNVETVSTSYAQNAQRARNLARDLDSDSYSEDDEVEDKTNIEIHLNNQTISTLMTLASFLRIRFMSLECCIENLPFLPIRLTDFVQIVQDKFSSGKNDVSLFVSDVDKSVSSLVYIGVLEEVYLRGECWINAKEEFSSEEAIEQLLKQLDPFLAVCHV